MANETNTSDSPPVLVLVGENKIVLHIPIADFVNIENWYHINLKRYLAEKESIELINQQVGKISHHQ